MPKSSAVRRKPATPYEEHLERQPSDQAIRAADSAGKTATRSTVTVYIGCKLSQGLVMELAEPGFVLDKDGKPVITRQPAPVGERVILKGSNSLRTDRRAAQGTHLYAITPVPRDFWNAWYAKYKDAEFVRKGFVFLASDAAQPDTALRDAQAAAKERIGERTGMEAIALKDDPRIKALSGPTMPVEVDPASLPANRDPDPQVVAV